MVATLAYATVGSNDLPMAKEFYDSLLAFADMRPLAEHPSGGRVYGSANSARIAVLPPHDGGVATPGNGAMIAFSFDTRSEVKDFHAKALMLGGTCEGPPGLRAAERYYAYFRDLDGNKICAFSLQVANVR